METIIEAQDVWKTYVTVTRGTTQKTSALAGLSLFVQPSEVVTIFGPNGCGKTTLLNIIAGLDRPDRGWTRIAGDATNSQSFGFVFQNYAGSLFPWRTNLSNIAFPLELAGVPKRDREKRVQDLCKRLDVKIDLHAYPYELSGGQQQFIAIARALAPSPVAVLMDEPFSSLDYHNRIMIEGKLLEVWEERKMSVLLVSHDIDEAIFLADRVVLLSRRPSRVLEVLETRLERPRKLEQTVESPRFLELKRRALSVFRGEIGL